MVLDAATLFPIALAIGGALGAFAAWLGWNKTPGEPFDVKKFITGLVTGIGAGLVLVLSNQIAIEAATNPSVFLALMVTIALSILGVDTVRTSVTGAIRGAAKTP